MDVAAEVATITKSARRLEAQLRAEQDRLVQQELNPFLANVCKEFNLPGVFLFGYTPGFNDGDVCEHSQQLAGCYGETPEGGIDFSKVEDFDALCEDLEAYGIEGAQFDSELDGQIALLSTLGMGDYNSPTHKAIETALDSMESAFEQAFGTNWFLLWKYDAETETVSLTRGEYEPGY